MTPRTVITLLVSVVVVPFAALAFAGCGSVGSTASSGAPTKANVRPTTVDTASTKSLGRILVDSEGRTLYLFEKDKGGRSACSGSCALAWPPLRAHGKPRAAGDTKASKVATTTRSDGTSQVTYNGHPLYLYQEDDKPGVVNGQGVNVWGGRWYTLTAAGRRVTKKGPPGSGGGY
jgi:predicted lipoprotein with Yx(FWY)xxD motif